MIGIGRRLKEERARLKFSQSALGAIGGVEINAQGNYESGTRFPRADYLSKIAHCGVDVTYVVTGLHLPDTEQPSPIHPLLQLEKALPQSQADSGERLASLIMRLQSNLHGITTDLYQISRLADAGAEGDTTASRQTQLETIKGEAEAIAMATLRLIFVTSRLSL
jgi:transcriptional regulator with XRE-family HTH domain